MAGKKWDVARALALEMLLACGASSPAVAAANYANNKETRAALDALKTEVRSEIESRWGALGKLAGRGYLIDSSGSPVWRELVWMVPGAVMRYHTGYCRRDKCVPSNYLVQYNAATQRLDFYQDNEIAATGTVRPDGSVLINSGMWGGETVAVDESSGGLKSGDYILQPLAPERLRALSRGLAGKALAEAPAPGLAPDQTATRAALRNEWGLLVELVDK